MGFSSIGFKIIIIFHRKATYFYTFNKNHPPFTLCGVSSDICTLNVVIVTLAKVNESAA